MFCVMNSLGGMAKWQEALCVYIKATVKGPVPTIREKERLAHTKVGIATLH